MLSRGRGSRASSSSTSSSPTCSASWQHMTLPLAALEDDHFEEGLGFDGSSIRGWQGISESDMLLVPQADTAILDPFTAHADDVAALRGDRPGHARAVRAGPAPRSPSAPRSTCSRPASPTPPTSARRASSSSSTTVSYDIDRNHAHYEVDSAEGHWNSGAPGLGYTIRPKEGYFPPSPLGHAPRPAHARWC